MRMFRRRSTLGGIMVGLCTIALTGVAALASHIPDSPFNFPTPFTVNPTAAGQPQGPFQANFIDFSYRAEIDQQPVLGAPIPTSTFQETGVAFFGTYRFPQLSDVLLSGQTGLNATYQLYARFSGTGTVSLPTGATEVNGVFDTFAAEFFLDPLTPITKATTVTPGLPNQSFSVTGNADDILVAETPGGLAGNGLVFACFGLTDPTGACGGFHVQGGLVGGDFDVVLHILPVGGYFTFPVPQGSSTPVLDFNGVFSAAQGTFAPPGAPATVDFLENGSGNASAAAAVPEPSTLLLLGTCLSMMGLVAWRRSKRSA